MVFSVFISAKVEHLFFQPISMKFFFFMCVPYKILCVVHQKSYFNGLKINIHVELYVKRKAYLFLKCLNLIEYKL
jgi:hypothetical protein